MKIRFKLSSFGIDTTQKRIKDNQGNELITTTLERILSFITMRYYYDKYETVFIHSDLYNNFSGNSRHYLDYLRDKGIILIDEKYIKGERSKGYMFTDYFKAFSQISDVSIDKLLDDDEVAVEEQDKKVTLEIDSMVKKKIIDDFHSILINETAIEKEILFYNDEGIPVVNFRSYLSNVVNLYRLKTKEYDLKFTAGRMYTPFVQLSKTVRESNIQLDEHRLLNLDIKNSFPMWLAILLLDKRIHMDFDTQEFFNEIISGDFYNQLMLKFNKNKDLYNNTEYVKPYLNKTDVKEHFMIWLNGNNQRDTLTNYVFRAYYPTIFEFIKEYKAGTKNTMYYELVVLESDFIFNSICKRLYQEIPEIRILTCHDQIYFSEGYEYLIKPIWEEEIQKVICRIPYTYNYNSELDDNDIDDLGFEF